MGPILFLFAIPLVFWYISHLFEQSSSNREAQRIEKERYSMKYQIDNFIQVYGNFSEDDFINSETKPFSTDLTKLSYIIRTIKLKNDTYAIANLQYAIKYIRELEEKRKKRKIELDRLAYEQYMEERRMESDPLSQRRERHIGQSYWEERAVVYMIYNNKTRCYYIGSTKNFTKRINQHFYELGNNTHHSYKLQRAFDEDGKDAFSIYALEVIDLPKNMEDKSDYECERWLKFQLLDLEQEAISKYKPYYNVEKDVYSHYM